MGVLRKFAVVVVSLVVVVGVLYAAGVVGPPSGGVRDVGDWGTVTEERTEIVTTLWVDNPNPVGLQTGRLRADYYVSMNGVRVAEGDKQGVDIRPGNNTVKLRTAIRNEKLQPWWVAYVENNETISVTAGGQATASTPLGTTSVSFPTQKRTMLENSTPVISGLSAAASELEGDYTKGVTVGGERLSVGYTVERAWAEWGSVNESSTVVLLHYRIRNAGDIALPAVPDGLQLNVTMNDVAMFAGGMDDASPRDIGPDAFVQPGETQTVTLAITMDNDKIDDWFRSHVRNGERTTMAVRLSLLFRSERADVAVQVPRDGPATITCDIQTAILVDDQRTETDCRGGPPA